MRICFSKTSKCSLRRYVCGGLLVAMASQAYASDFASVGTYANTHGLAGQGPFIDIPGLRTTQANGQTTESTGQLVGTATSGGVTSTISVFGSAAAPVSIGALGEVKASVSIDAIATPPSAFPNYQWVDAHANASFRDFIKLGALPTNGYMVLNFQLTGSLAQTMPSPFYGPNSPATANVFMSVSAETGSFFAPGGFGVYSEGETHQIIKLENSIESTAGLENFSLNSAGYSSELTAPGNYKITLGSVFLQTRGALI